MGSSWFKVESRYGVSPGASRIALVEEPEASPGSSPTPHGSHASQAAMDCCSATPVTGSTQSLDLSWFLIAQNLSSRYGNLNNHQGEYFIWKEC